MFIDFDENGDGVLALDEFSELVRSLEPSLSPEKVIALFNEALDMSATEELTDKMSPESFCEMVIKHRLGGYGSEFFSFK